jgi:hypothetical protein
MTGKTEAELLSEASKYVIEHARFDKSTFSCEQPYTVRFPLSSARLLRAADTMELAEKVAAIMKRYAANR